MPSKSEKQRELMAIAEHDPVKVYSKNKGVLNMKKEQLHDFSSTKGLKKSGDQGSHLHETDHNERMGHTQ